MDWKLTWGTFAAIFVAEMGDKTQLAAFAMSSGSGSKWSVFIGASLALIATTIIAVVAGGWVGKHIPEIWIKRGAGALFLAMGLSMLLSSSGMDTPSDESSSDVGETSN